MKVIVNGTQLLSPLTGIGQYVRHLFSAMQCLPDTDVRIFYGRSFRQGIVLPSPRKARLLQQLRGMVLRAIPKPRQLKKKLEAHFFKQGVARLGQGCVYHEPNFLALPYEGPLVVTVHDLSCFDHPEMHPAERVRLMHRELPAVLERADQIIVISAATGLALQRWFGVSAARIHVTHLAADARYHPRTEAVLQAPLAGLGLQPQGYVLSVGTLEPRKNLQALFTAYSGLPDTLRKKFPLAVAGMRGWHQEQALKAADVLLRCGELRLLGYVPDGLVPALYAGAAAFVYPSRYEGFGLPPLEAMASAVPVLTSNGTSLPEVVGEAGLMVDADDVDALRQSLRRLLEDRLFAAELGQAGLLRSRSFSWERCAQATRAVYTLAAGQQTSVVA